MRIVHRTIAMNGKPWTDAELEDKETAGAKWRASPMKCQVCNATLYSLQISDPFIQFALACKKCPAIPAPKPAPET